MNSYLPQLPGSQATPPARTLIDILNSTAAAFPDASALDDGRRSLSYAELLSEVKAYAKELHLAGLGAGDRSESASRPERRNCTSPSSQCY